MEQLLIFHSDNGQDCNTYNLVKSDDDKDLAVFRYLRSIGNFAWDKDTTLMQEDIKSNNHTGLYNKLQRLIDRGYDCFLLDTNYNVTLTKFDAYYK